MYSVNSKELLLLYFVSATSRLPKPTFKDLVSLVWVTDVYGLALHLNLDRDYIDVMMYDIPNTRERLLKVFNMYLNQTDKPSWQDVLKALEDIGEKRLAREIIRRLEASNGFHNYVFVCLTWFLHKNLMRTINTLSHHGCAASVCYFCVQ